MTDNISHHTSLSPTNSNESLTISDESEHSPLYRSLEESIKLPSCVSNEWVDTIADLKTNPRTLTDPPYNDRSLHWVDNNNHVLNMTFPAVLNIDGKYSKVGPYFNLSSETVKVLSIFSLITLNTNSKHYFRNRRLLLLAK